MTEKISSLNTENYESNLRLEDKDFIDFHSKNTIIFGSLIEDGWDWGRNEWSSYSVKPENIEVLRERINRKIEDRFFYREIGVLPPGRFKRNLRRKIEESIDQLGPLYNAIMDDVDVFSSGSKSLKERVVLSEFPQQQIMTGNSDYASNAQDHNLEERTTGNFIETFIKFQQDFKEPDTLLLKKVEVCFSNLLSFNY